MSDGMTEVFFDIETQRFVYGGDHTDILFNDETQTIGFEVCSDDGYISWERETVRCPKEYFARKLAGK